MYSLKFSNWGFIFSFRYGYLKLSVYKSLSFKNDFEISNFSISTLASFFSRSSWRFILSVCCWVSKFLSETRKESTISSELISVSISLFFESFLQAIKVKNIRIGRKTFMFFKVLYYKNRERMIVKKTKAQLSSITYPIAFSVLQA